MLKEIGVKIRIFPENNYKAIFYKNCTFRVALDSTKPITNLEYAEFYDIALNDKCHGKCPDCFIEGTKISTKDGDINIQDINIGDLVYSINKETSELQLCNVDQLHQRNYEGIIIEIELDNGNIIKSTPNHKIYTSNRGWIRSDELTSDDTLLQL